MDSKKKNFFKKEKKTNDKKHGDVGGNKKGKLMLRAGMESGLHVL